MSEASDRQEIRELVENWVVWRDAGDWAANWCYAVVYPECGTPRYGKLVR